MINIVYYGERGVVNSIIADMGKTLDKHKAFLEAIRLTDGKKLDWASDITEPLTYIVEISLAEFGDPDLIVVAKANNKKYVLFIEAKLRAYDDESVAVQGGESNPHIDSYDRLASKVNVQLSLKYRFVNEFKKRTSKTVNPVVVPQITNQDRERKLKKPYVINNLCNEYFFGADDYYFIALSNDSITVDPYSNALFLPPIGEDWQKAKSHFGIVSYEMLEKNKAVDSSSGCYSEAKRGMIGSPADTGQPQTGYVLSTQNMSKWTAKQRDSLEIFCRDLETKADCRIEKYPGSYSVKVRGITAAKFFASATSKDGDIVYLVFRNDGLPEKFAQNKKVLIGRGDNLKSFAVVYEGPADGIMAYLEDTLLFVGKY